MYGENTGLLRQALSELLRHHRIQHRIGGPGLHTVPETTTAAERTTIGEQIGRYRHAALVWCDQAMRAADPRTVVMNGTGGIASTHHARPPDVELRYRLFAAINASGSTLPTLEELTTQQRFPLVESWRQAARACALSEHDFSAGVGHGRLSHTESVTVIRDAADVTRALVGLDRRYANIPGWQSLKNPGRLGRAAEVCAATYGPSDNRGPDYAVDLRGWKPTPQLIDAPRLTGISGVLQAQHNLLVHLNTFPDATSLRIVLDSQRVVSRETTKRLSPHDQANATKWEVRAETYGRLVKETRDLGGTVGNGGPAAGQGSIAATRMAKLPPDGLANLKQVGRIEQVSAGIDARICDLIEHGIKQRLYFQRTSLPVYQGELVNAVGPTYRPITSPVQSDLWKIARSDLRPAPAQPKTPQGAAQSRRDFEAAITHRPGDPGPGPSLSI